MTIVRRDSVALAHDYLTQLGGAERVALIMAQTFPEAPFYTTLHDPRATFSEFEALDLHLSPLNRVALLRAHHRLALPLLAPTVATTTIDAEVVLASSSGWAHGMHTSGRKIVYCHAPARWLYQRDRYFGPRRPRRGRPDALALTVLSSSLRRWDRRAAESADRYLVNSTVTQDAVRQIYGIEAEIVAPPPALLPQGEEEAVPGVEPGFMLCVARLLPYKHVDVVIQAVTEVPGLRLVVVGEGPERDALAALAAGSARVTLLGRVRDPMLRWLYRNCDASIAASYEDYGLTPLEAASFGRPTLALHAGGFLDTVVEGRTGAFFDQPVVESVRTGLETFDATGYDPTVLKAHAAAFSRDRFQARLRDVVAEERAASS